MSSLELVIVPPRAATPGEQAAAWCVCMHSAALCGPPLLPVPHLRAPLPCLSVSDCCACHVARFPIAARVPCCPNCSLQHSTIAPMLAGGATASQPPATHSQPGWSLPPPPPLLNRPHPQWVASTPPSLAAAVTDYKIKAVQGNVTVTTPYVLWRRRGDGSLGLSFPASAFLGQPAGKYVFTAAAVNADGTGPDCSPGVTWELA